MHANTQEDDLPSWAPQGLLELERCRQDLQSLKDQQIQELETASRSFECALLGAQREERRLMDRVEQEHQEVRRLLEQLQRDNVARVQAMQNTIDERILNLTQLRDRMQQGGQKSLGQDLQQKLSELLPRELTLSLKRVSFQPNPNLPSLFGKIRVQEQSLRFSVSCGGQSRGACVSSMGVNQTQYRNGNAGEAADSQVTRHMPEKPVTSSGSVRVVRKIRISPRAEETGDEKGSPRTESTLVKEAQVNDTYRDGDITNKPGLSSSPQLPRVPAIDLSTLSDPNTHILGVGGDNDEDLGLFQAVPAFLSDGESENGEEEVAVENSMERNHVRDSPVSSRALILLSSRRPSARHEGGLERTSRCWGSVDSISCEGSYKGHGLTVNQHSTESGTQNDGTGPGKDKSNLTDVRSRQSQNTICDESKGIQAANRNNQSPPNVSKRDSRYSFSSVHIPRTGVRDSAFTQSCLDLSPSNKPPSRTDLSPEETNAGVPGEIWRPASPADSIDSSYTFIVNSPRDYSITLRRAGVDPRLSKSTVDLSRKVPPLIESFGKDKSGQGKCNRNRLLPNASPALRRGLNRIESTNVTRGFKNKNSTEFHCFSAPSSVCRSVSMSAIEVPSACSKQGNGRLKLKTFRSAREQKQGGRGEAEREAKTDQAELAIQEEDGERQDQVRLISKFGKFGSGRAELSLPSGVHAMPQGQLYVVDCGNARVQVTDTRGNILQQVSFQGHEGAAGRRCRNYFDVAVNGKGLIALSCAAEKALLIFSRHGRRLQAFGGGGDELEAPRGVAVNYHDEFLVADTRRGTLTAFKLDPKSGSKLERTVVPGFCKPYLVATGLATGLVAVSERGSETGGAPCVKVLGPNWNTLRILGIDTRLGPVLSCPWGVCIDRDGDVLVADWGKEHRVLLYSAQGSGRPVVTQGLNSPRGLTLLPEGHLVVADSMHNCIKIFQYK
ncbi:uncharacterized protein LOC136751393 [Amia ocellicauda]|uniref:uncharacterized protein LOC136751393 n=1 Tax=Amia ocellicauda TaxID=2972642 RepID=UPI003464CA36